MDVTADTLLNQVSTLFLDKIDKQTIDPDFLKGFMKTLLNKFSYKETGPIKQQSKTPSQQNTSSGGIVNDIKKAYKELLKDSSYISNYKQFLKKVFPSISLQEQKPALPFVPTSSTKVTNITNNTYKEENYKNINNTYNKENYEENRPNLIKEETKSQVVLLGGITEQGYKNLQEKLPSILKKLFFKQTVKESMPSKDIMSILGGAGLILGGLAALVGAFMTQGPMKGTLELIGKVGLKGGLVLLAKKLFGATLKTVLKRIPIIGTLISYGFAIQRFMNGDTIGGIIDLVSGTVQLLDLVVPGLGSVLSLGVDILQAVLDVKAGGSDAKASAKKGTILLDWTKSLGSLLYKGIKYVPVIGPLIQSVEDMMNGKWLDATHNLIRAIPGVGVILDVLNWFTEGQTTKINKSGLTNVGNKITEWVNWLRESIIDKLSNLVGNVLDWGKEKITNLVSNIPGYNLLFGDDTNKQATTTTDNNSVKPASTKTSPPQQSQPITQPEVKMAKGGIVTKPTTALVGEAGPEAVLPLNKMFDTAGISLNNSTLDQIANNTKDTNKALSVLADAIIKMVGAFNQKMSVQNGTTIINAGGGSKDTTSASMASNFNLDPIRRVRAQFAV